MSGAPIKTPYGPKTSGPPKPPPPPASAPRPSAPATTPPKPPPPPARAPRPSAPASVTSAPAPTTTPPKPSAPTSAPAPAPPLLPGFLTGNTNMISPFTEDGKNSASVISQIASAKSNSIDCQGYWGPCDFIQGVQTYIVTRPASGGGAACPNKTGDTKSCKLDYIENLKSWLLSLMTVQNFTILFFVLIILAVMRGVFSTMREFFGGSGGSGVTIIK